MPAVSIHLSKNAYKGTFDSSPGAPRHRCRAFNGNAGEEFRVWRSFATPASGVRRELAYLASDPLKPAFDHREILFGRRDLGLVGGFQALALGAAISSTLPQSYVAAERPTNVPQTSPRYPRKRNIARSQRSHPSIERHALRKKLSASFEFNDGSASAWVPVRMLVSFSDDSLPRLLSSNVFSFAGSVTLALIAATLDAGGVR